MDKTQTSALSNLAKLLSPISKKAERRSQSKILQIQPDLILRAKNPNIGRDYVNAVESSFFKTLFRAEQLPHKNQLTYEKPHYFPSGHNPEKPESPYLLKERFKEKKERIHAPKLLFGAKYKLNSTGTLHMTPTGLVFLKVDEAFVETAYPYFEKKGAEKPPFIAHIPVISEEETQKLQAKGFKELSQSFQFSVKDCIVIEPAYWSEMDKIWALSVESEELEQFREKYGLSSKLHSQDFIIVVGMKKRSDIDPEEEVDKHYLRVSPTSVGV